MNFENKNQSSENFNCYQELKIRKDASDDEIKTVYVITASKYYFVEDSENNVESVRKFMKLSRDYEHYRFGESADKNAHLKGFNYYESMFLELLKHLKRDN